jgi:hypothetical protein
MKQVIYTDLPALGQPFSWACAAAAVMFRTKSNHTDHQQQRSVNRPYSFVFQAFKWSANFRAM